MRTNLPVTQKEVVLDETRLIVSRTDLQGAITYVNRDFVEVSGFTEAELIGAPHNIVRHPDMPVEAFADLWATLKAGRPWVGLVKNRCKNGDYYWVLANAAPVVEQGQVTGYLSVRRRASPAAIAAHESVYRRFREKQAGGLAIRFGQAVEGGWRARLHGQNLSIGARLWLAIASIVAIAMVAIGSAWWGMNESQQRFSGFIAQEQKLLDSYSGMYAQGLQVGQAIRNIALDAENRKAYDNHQQANKDFQAELATAQSVQRIDPAIGRSLQRIAELSSRQFELHDKILEAVKSGDAAAARRMLNENDTPLWRDYKKILLDDRLTLRQQAKRGQEDVQAMVTRTERISALAMLGTLLAAIVTAVLLSRSIRRPMAKMNETFDGILQGDYSNTIEIARNDEIGKALQGLQVLQTRMGFEVSEARRQAEEMTRIKFALDTVTMPVTVSDEKNALIYLNRSAQALWSAMADGIRRTHAGFDASKLLGARLADYFDDDDTRTAYRAELVDSRTLDTELAAHALRVTASPVRDSQGKYLGRVSQWMDRTLEIQVEKEVAEIVRAAAAGDLEQRMTTDDKSGFFATLGVELNRLLATTQQALAATSSVLERMAQGDLTQRIEGDYAGIFGRLQSDVNATVERLREAIGRIKESTGAIDTAAQEIASGNTDLSSRTEQQASSLEQTSSSMEQLNSTVKQNADSARRANELSHRANSGVMRSGQVVKQVVATMGAIQTSSRKIADIIGAIDGIAFQTNILALNAAVEAARAGEQGRGFAVVATEVRALAQRSALAAKEIKALIAESVDKVESGVKQVSEAGGAIDDVVVDFQQVATLVTDIANASREQSSGIEQVTQAVSQMDEVTQQNAALVEQAAAAAESLEEQARGLMQAVAMFKILDADSRIAIPSVPTPMPRIVPDPRKALTKALTGRKTPPAYMDDEGDQWAEF